MNKKKIKIDVVSDVVCPWCYIGKRRLERALEALQHDFEFEVNYLPFELNPTTPEGGLDQKLYLSNKFGGDARYQQVTNHVKHIAAEEGLQFNFDIQKVYPNTRVAHAIIRFAKQQGKQAEVKEAFMSAYFEKGIDLSKNENLVSVAGNCGLDKKDIEAILTSAEKKLEVEQLEQELQQLGITGVPFYIIENKYGVSGAQPTDVFIETFTKIGEEKAATVK